MSARDLKIDLRVRGLFVKNYIDLKHVKHQTVKGVVYISGKLIHIRDESPVSGVEIARLDKEIRKIPDVEDVVWNIRQRAF
ncbi:hypothetical protein J7K56_03195 [Candidatus Calescamantes bacterium]|nr:hypothetical protein [Candidatus Calescamantes bacterium]